MDVEVFFQVAIVRMDGKSRGEMGMRWVGSEKWEVEVDERLLR